VSHPLGGYRIAVKDLFHLLGIRSALNVRAFLESHDADTFTADYLRLLIDLGAVIVGKTKMTAFAGGERAPEYWIDFHCPFNPRADGYQTPSGSTSGGAACLAGYKWLDFSLGSDSESSTPGQ
jgi:Asp-tRNA(Asn)/Glu-tRNA(Gln) amidotransferase A subunit family amidase